MTVEADIYNLLKDLVPVNQDGRKGVWPDFAPAGVARPYLTYQQVGGQSISYVGREVPSKKNGRIQINCWADTRSAASALALQVESALITTTMMQATPLGALISTYDEETMLYGAYQDFSVWSDR